MGRIGVEKLLVDHLVPCELKPFRDVPRMRHGVTP
jgi:hypothetical protein